MSKDQTSGQGNRALNSIFHNLAVQQIQVAKGINKKQRNLLFYEFYQRKLAEARRKKASPYMHHEKACEHHLQHDEEENRIQGGESSNGTQSRMI
jgi:D-ribose pyranose/furanose isomerase RbsD